jgi:regulator of sigma E protease
VDNRLETLGVSFWVTHGKRALEFPEPSQSLTDASRSIKDTLGALFSKKSDVSVSHLSSAVGIGHVYYSLLQDPEGWRRVLWFSVVLNVNLALLNLLPLPVLDGGHITMAVLEWIRRRPLNIRVLEVVQTACVLLLLGLMGFLILKDLGGIFRVGEQKEAVPDKDAIEEKFLAPDKRPATP